VSDQFFWFATRGAGLMAWFASSTSVLVGLSMSSRLLGRRPTLPWLTDLHRYFGAMAMVFLGIHMGTLWADSFVSFSWPELLIPGRAEVPGLTRMSIAWGVISAWLLAIVELSSLIKKHLPTRLWHTVHLTSFGVVVMGSVHAIEVGSDSTNRVLIAPAASILTSVVLVALVRLSRYLSDRKYRFEADVTPAPAGYAAPRQRRRAAQPQVPQAPRQQAQPRPAPPRPAPRQPAPPRAAPARPPRPRRPAPRPRPRPVEQPVRWEDRR
jgi:hypothetical protein